MMHKDVTEKLASRPQSPFVSVESEADLSHAFDAQRDIDVSFLKQNTWLQHPPVHIHEQVLIALSGRISRNPNDLYSLTKRIYLLKALEEKEKLAGAVYDLLYCLQNRGESLRLRVLHSVRQMLNTDEYERLTQLNTRSSIRQNATHYEHSLLSEGVWGSTAIVEKHHRDKPIANVSSPFNDAKEFINQGEIDAAIRILEECLQKSPSDQDVSNELYLIYSHMRNFAAIAQLRQILDEHKVPYPEQWLDTETKLRDEATRT